MGCYILMISLADGELEVLRASSQRGSQILGHPLTLCLYFLQETSQLIVRPPSKRQWAWNMVFPQVSLQNWISLPFGDCRVSSKLKVNKYSKMWNRNGSQRRDWRREVAILDVLPYGLSTFDYFMNAWGDTLVSSKPCLYMPFRIIIHVNLDNEVIGYNDWSSNSGSRLQIIYNNNCY